MSNHKLIPKSGAWVLITNIINTAYPVHRLAIYYAYPTGKYFFTDERSLGSLTRCSLNPFIHPSTGHDYSHIMDAFALDKERLKLSISNYKRNPHHEFTEREKVHLDGYGDSLDVDLPIEAQVKIVTEYGNISIHPEEYSIVSEAQLKEYFESVQSGDAFISYLSKSKQLKGKVADQVFYLQSRGIGFSDAIRMCIGAVKTSNLLYLYMHPGYVEMFTKEKVFKAYVNRHLKAMKDFKLPDEANAYLDLVKQIDGYGFFNVSKEEIVEKALA